MLLCVWWDAPLALGRAECWDIVLELADTNELRAVSPGDCVPFIDI